MRKDDAESGISFILADSLLMTVYETLSTKSLAEVAKRQIQKKCYRHFLDYTTSVLFFLAIITFISILWLKKR